MREKHGPTSEEMAAPLRALAWAWLEEVRADNFARFQAMPALAEVVGAPAEETLTELAVDYQRLFGFGVPPYESVFLDPSAMLMAPATARVQAFYRRVGWRPPAGVRVGAADHVGVELLLLADLLAAGRQADAERLVQEHLAFWIPPLVVALRGLNPAPFYATLADQTLTAVLSLLQDTPSPVHLPALPPPPRYEARGLPEPRSGPRQDDGLHEFVRALLTPREAGLYITRDDLGRLSRHVELPPVVADRRAMLMTMLRLAGQYDELPQVMEGLSRLLDHAANTYQAVAEAFPAWRPYAACWLERLEATAAQVTAVQVAP